MIEVGVLEIEEGVFGDFDHERPFVERFIVDIHGDVFALHTQGEAEFIRSANEDERAFVYACIHEIIANIEVGQ